MANSKHSTNFYLLVGIVAIVYIVTGFRKLIGIGSAIENFENWGYSPVLMYFLGLAELLGAIGLLIPKTRIPAMAGLAVVMIGAIGTHIINGEYYTMLLPLVLLALLVLLFLMSRDELEEANLRESDKAGY